MNLKILFVAIMYGIVENSYFGWNMVPASDSEMVCDALGFVLFALAFLDLRPTIRIIVNNEEA